MLSSAPSRGSEVPEPGDRYLLEALESEGLLRAYLLRFTRNPADVDELLQETYARLLAVRPAERVHIRSVQALAITTARNVALDWLRHRDVIPMNLVADIAALDLLDESAKVEEIVNAHQELALLTECIAQLPARCRQAFTLRRVYGLSQHEIAQRLKIAEGTVEQLLARAVRRCAEYLFAREAVGDRPYSLSERLGWRRKRHE